VEQAQPHVQVAACAADCHHRLANGWCHSEVRAHRRHIMLCSMLWFRLVCAYSLAEGGAS
jgi:hypothetical protein